MAKSGLKMDYKDAQYLGNRKFLMIQNDDGTVSFEDRTTYTQDGDELHSQQLNTMNDYIDKSTSIKHNEIVKDELTLSTLSSGSGENIAHVRLTDGNGNTFYLKCSTDDVMKNNHTLTDIFALQKQINDNIKFYTSPTKAIREELNAILD